MDWRVLLVFSLVLGVAAGGCDTSGGYAPELETIEGQVWLTAPVPQVPVRLYRTDPGGEIGELVFEGAADRLGRYQFAGQQGPGDYLVVADLSGVVFDDPYTGARAVIGAGETLTALVPGIGFGETRQAQLTPVTTLVTEAADALREAGARFAVTEALNGMQAHLGFDPVRTPIADVALQDLSDPTTHRLLLRAFAALAARASDEAGAQRGTTLNPHRLLQALREDVSGQGPPARFDGEGPGGAVVIPAGRGRYRVSAETLRAQWADAVVELVAGEDGEDADAGSTPDDESMDAGGGSESDEAPPTAGEWRRLTPDDVAHITGRLRCSPSPLFPPCRGGPADETAPEFETPDPPDGTLLDHARYVTIRARDPESGIAELVVSRRLTGEGLPETLSAPYDDRDDRPEVAVIELDPAGLIGNERVELSAVAHNTAGRSSELRFGYRVFNLGTGELGGFVVKGPARHVEVEVWRLRTDGSRERVGAAVSGPEGDFQLQVPEWQGPVLVTARAAPGGSAADPSAFVDEARGRLLTWDAGQTLSTVYPAFDSSRENPPLVVSPLADLAFARAEGLARRGQQPLLGAYEESLRLLAAHFGLQPETVLSVRPAPLVPDPDAPERGAENEADRFLLALACLSQRALEVARETRPASAVDDFTALHLLAAYREDVETDGLLDGRVGLAPLRVDDYDLPDDFRGPLASACAAWLQGDYNHTHLTVPGVATLLDALAQDPSALFDPDLPTSPFDDAGPQVELLVDPRPGPGNAAAPLDSTTWALRGEVRLLVAATDPTGLQQLDVDLDAPDGVPLVIEQHPDATATTTATEWIARLDTQTLPDGVYPLTITARDALDHETQASYALRVDTQPPQIALIPPLDAPGTFLPSAWFTRAAPGARLLVDVTLDEPAQLTAQFRDQPLDLPAAPAPGVPGAQLTLIIPADEQRAVLTVTARDALGQESTHRQPIYIDRTPPRIERHPTRMKDETYLDWSRDPAQVDAEVDLIPGAHVAKWQNWWTPIAGDDPRCPDDPDRCHALFNPARLSWSVQDPESDDIQVAFHWRVLYPDEEAEPDFQPLAPPAAGDRSRTLDLDADTLRLDHPIDEPKPLGTPLVVEYQAIDAAGNVSDISQLPLVLDMLAPPPLVEESGPAELPDDVVDLSAVRFEAENVQRLVSAPSRLVVLKRMRIENPHPMPIRVWMHAPEYALLDLDVDWTRQGVPASADGDQIADVDGVRFELNDCAYDGVTPRSDIVVRDAQMHRAGRTLVWRGGVCAAIRPEVAVVTHPVQRQPQLVDPETFDIAQDAFELQPGQATALFTVVELFPGSNGLLPYLMSPGGRGDNDERVRYALRDADVLFARFICQLGDCEPPFWRIGEHVRFINRLRVWTDNPAPHVPSPDVPADDSGGWMVETGTACAVCAGHGYYEPRGSRILDALRALRVEHNNPDPDR